jgi:uncharacterized repeat protein (TIGR01451 family)
LLLTTPLSVWAVPNLTVTLYAPASLTNTASYSIIATISNTGTVTAGSVTFTSTLPSTPAPLSYTSYSSASLHVLLLLKL